MTKCKTTTCQLRERCKRHTAPAVKDQAYAHYKPHRVQVAGTSYWACNEYWFNGQKHIQ